MTRMMRGLLAGAFLAALSTGAMAAPDKRHAIAGIGIDLQTTDPHKVSGGGDYFFFSNTFEGLYGHDLDGKLAPELALSHEVTPDGLVYTFKLRPNVKFHNGDPFTAEDVRFSWQRANDPEIKNPRASIVTKNIKEIEIVDPLTVKLVLSKPDAAMLENLGEYFYIVPKKHIEQVGNDAFSRQPVGTGPYKFVSRRIKEVIELEAHKDHWGRVPGVDKLSLRVVPDAQTRVAMLQTGEADLIVAVPPHMAKAIEANPETKMVLSPSFQNIEILLSNRGPHAGLRSTKVRQALNMAVDKKAMIDKVMFGYATQSIAPCHVEIIGCRIDRQAYPYDPKKAKALLDEEKFDYAKPLKMFAQAGGRVPQSKEVMEAVVFYLGQVGVKVDVEFMEYGAWLAGLGARQHDKYDGLYRNWTDYNNDPMGRLPRAYVTDGYYSWASFPEVDKMVAEANAITDPKKREEHLKAIFTKLYDDPPSIILWTTENTDAARKNVDWKPRNNVSWPVFYALKKN